MLNLRVRKKAGFALFGSRGSPLSESGTQELDKEQKASTRKPVSLKRKPASLTQKPAPNTRKSDAHSPETRGSPEVFPDQKAGIKGETRSRKYSSPGLSRGSVSKVQKVTGSEEKPLESLAGTEELTEGSRSGAIEDDLGESAEVLSEKGVKMEATEKQGKSGDKERVNSDVGEAKEKTIESVEVVAGSNSLGVPGVKGGEGYTEVQAGTKGEGAEPHRSHDTEGRKGSKDDMGKVERRMNKGLYKGDIKTGNKREGVVLTAVTRLDSYFSSCQTGQTTPGNTDVMQPLSVDTTKTQPQDNTKAHTVQPKVSPMAGTYLTDKQNPSFRIQKPVLLHPTRSGSGHGARVTSVPEEGGYPQVFTEDNWRPHRLFTNEQIAGRQVQLVTLQKSCESEEIGITLELQFLSLGRTGLVVTEVTTGGPAHKQGGVHCGDELLMVSGICVIDMAITKATSLLVEEYRKAKGSIQLVVAKALPSDSTEQVTYF